MLFILTACKQSGIDGHIINNTDDTLIGTSPYGTDTMLPRSDDNVSQWEHHPYRRVNFTCCPCDLINEDLIIVTLNPKKKLLKDIHEEKEWQTENADKRVVKCTFTINKFDIVN